MPIHDWTRVHRSLFHSFYLDWVSRLSGELNACVLPSSCYSLTETLRDNRALFLELPEGEDDFKDPGRPGKGYAFSDSAPRTWLQAPCVRPEYADRIITIRRCDCHAVVAAIRIVTPDDKHRFHRFGSFAAWAVEVIRSGVALLMVDLFPTEPGSKLDITEALWDEFVQEELDLPSNKPLTLIAFSSGAENTVYLEPVSVGDVLPTMPLFLKPDLYVPVPLETSYQTSWNAIPEALKDEFR